MREILPSNNLVVAKFGGTSMAHPERVLQQLDSYDQPPAFVVVSAPGKTPECPTKVTDMIRGYARSGKTTVDDIQRRYEDIARLMDPSATERSIWGVIDQIPVGLKEFALRNYPLDALGEFWSAKMFAAYSGRQLLQADRYIRIDDNRQPDINATARRIKTLPLNREYILPGYYGGARDDSVCTLGRGGSDVSGLLILLAYQDLLSGEYHNWSDVDGFMSADPCRIKNTRLLDEITYREARELANGGNELLHRSVGRFLGGSAIQTVMRNTFGELGNRGTSVVSERDWEDRHVVGISGQGGMLELSLHEAGMNEEFGGTLALYQALADLEVPYEHAATGTDDVSVFVRKKSSEGEDYEDRLEAIVELLTKGNGRKARLEEAGFIHIVGEAISKSAIERLHILGAAATALSEEGIGSRGSTDVAQSPALTIFVDSDRVDDATQVVHDALGLGAAD